MIKYKIITIALGIILLSSCTAKTVNTVGSSDSVLSSTDNSSTFSSNGVSSSGNQSSDNKKLISSILSSSTTIAVDTQTSKKAKRIIKEFKNSYEPIIVFPEASTIKNDPAIYECNKNYMLAGSLVNIRKKDNIKLSSTDKKFKKEIIEFLINNLIGANWNQAFRNEYKEKKKMDILKFVHLKPIDGYDVFCFKCENLSMTMISTYNRMAGYQFLVEPDFLTSEFAISLLNKDEYKNFKIPIKSYMNYCGVLLYKDGKYELLENAYMDGKITGETVGKIYNALPKYVQYGKFDNYKDAYMLTPFKFTSYGFECSSDKVDFAWYFEKNGSFHVIY